MRIQLLHFSHHKECSGKQFQIVDCNEALAKQWIAARGAREVEANTPLTVGPTKPVADKKEK